MLYCVTVLQSVFFLPFTEGLKNVNTEYSLDLSVKNTNICCKINRFRVDQFMGDSWTKFFEVESLSCLRRSHSSSNCHVSSVPDQ
jgi:hypothetical protein